MESATIDPLAGVVPLVAHPETLSGLEYASIVCELLVAKNIGVGNLAVNINAHALCSDRVNVFRRKRFR